MFCHNLTVKPSDYCKTCKIVNFEKFWYGFFIGFWVCRKCLRLASRAVRIYVVIPFSLRVPPERLNVFFTLSVRSSEQMENPKKTLTAFF